MKNIFQIFFVFVFILCCNKLHSQEIINKDSLLNELQTMNDDTGKVEILRNLCYILRFSEPQEAIEYGEKGISLSEKINFHKGKSECLHEIGIIHYYQGQYDKSLENYLAALKILEEKLDTTKAVTKKLIADNFHGIGKIYYRLKQFEKALSYYEQSLAIYKQVNYKAGIATCLNNIGGVYDARNDFEKTLYYLKESLKIIEEIGDKDGIATRVNNIGLQYKAQKKYDEALKYLTRALKIREEIGDIKGLAYSYTDIGELYGELKNYGTALNFLNKGLEFAMRSNARERIKASYETLSGTYSQMKKFDKAYEYHLLLSALKDSLFNEESSKQIAEMSEKYESGKKQHQIELLQKDKELQASELAKSDAERKKQQIQKSAFAIGFILVLVLALVIFRSYRQKQKANTLLAEKNILIEEQKKLVEIKNKDITDSIRYAENIQSAVLIPIEDIKKALPGSFVLFKPKDIVSGDFYFFTKVNQYIIIAACDSTGHGVPGAFMSMIGSQLLNQIVNDKSVTDAAQILNQLRDGIIHAFGVAGATGVQKDGMDMAICCIKQNKNKNVASNSTLLQYAGANNPLYIMKKGANELIEVKPDKQPIGYTYDKKPFTNHDIQLKKGDTFYISSDGYQDQFGGPKGKKFMSKQFRQLFIDIQTMSMEEQKIHLDKTIEEWKGESVQVDDILVIGVKV